MNEIDWDVICNECWKKMIFRKSIYWIFLWCSWYPKCKNKKILEKNINFSKPYSWLDFYWITEENIPKEKNWYVYLLYIKEKDLYKIWFTETPIQRISNIANKFNKKYKYKNPIKWINLCKLYKTSNYKTLEAQLHYLLDKYRAYKKEYFRIPYDIINNITINMIWWFPVIEQKELRNKINNYYPRRMDPINKNIPRDD
jgi:ssDNA-binding Zn-finger/Zn-ribbon topoisomerase 1